MLQGYVAWMEDLRGRRTEEDDAAPWCGLCETEDHKYRECPYRTAR